MRKLDKKGFTLIELLAVIVILGVVMAIAIPSMNTTIENSKKDSVIDSARYFVEGAYNMLLSENSLPGYGKAAVVSTSKIELSKGGTSPYTQQAYDGASSYVVIVNTASANGTATSAYKYYVALKDTDGNCLTLTDDDALGASAKTTRTYIKSGTNCSVAAASVATDTSVNTTSGSSTSVFSGLTFVAY